MSSVGWSHFHPEERVAIFSPISSLEGVLYVGSQHSWAVNVSQHSIWTCSVVLHVLFSQFTHTWCVQKPSTARFTSHCPFLRGHIAVGYLWDVSGSQENVGRFLSLTLQGFPSQTDAVCPRGHSLSPHCICQKIFLFRMVWFSLWGFDRKSVGVKFLLEPPFGNQAPETAAALSLRIIVSYSCKL